MLGSTLGSYRIERELGRGGMGAVFVGTHTLLGRSAAIKVLLPKYSQDQEIVQRFFNEARAATAIKDPGIVEIYDYGRAEDGSAFIVMELCEGESLAQRLRHRRAMPIVTALTIARQIANTLAAAHRTGIVHRDLKPDNVFVVPDPEVAGGERIKLLDFGIAKLVAETAGPTKTTTGTIMGTPYYMSPEQCRGAGQVDHRSDLYSLGCMLFEMVCGRVPFVGEGSGDIISAHLLIAPPAPSSMASNIPAEVEDLILRLLAKKPGDRLADADAVAEELQRLAATIPPTLEPNARVQLGNAETVRSDRPVAVDAPTAATASPDTPSPQTTLQNAAEPAEAPKPRRISLAVAAGAAATSIFILVVTRGGNSSESPSGSNAANGSSVASGSAAGGSSAGSAAVALGPDAPRIIIGELGGDDMTPAIQRKIRPKLASQLATLAPDVRTVLEPTDDDRAAGRLARAFQVGGALRKLDIGGGKLTCNVLLSIDTYPDAGLIASFHADADTFLSDSVDDDAAGCVHKVTEELLRRLLPVLRGRLASSASVDYVRRNAAPMNDSRVTSLPLRVFELEPGSTPRPFEAPKLPAKLDRDAIDLIVPAYHPKIFQCMLPRLQRSVRPVVVRMDIVIAADGKTPKSGVEVQPDDPTLEECLRKVAYSMVFPKPKGDFHMVRYPIELRPSPPRSGQPPPPTEGN